jgi:hypothetical protein
MPLVELANELLLEVVDHILADVPRKGYTNGLFPTENALTRLYPLSETCKRLNDICSWMIFRQYRVSLDNPMTNEMQVSQCLCLLGSLTPSSFICVFRQQRLEPGTLEHALTKADYIQEMIISHGDHTEDSFTAYEDSVVEPLLELVNTAPKLTSVILRGDVRQLPSRFWSALLSKPLRHLEIQSWTSFAPDVQIADSLLLDKFVLSYHESTAKLLEVCPFLISLGLTLIFDP